MEFHNVTINNTDKFLKEDINVSLCNLGVMAAKIAFYNYEGRYDTIAIFNLVALFALRSFLINYRKAIIVKKGKVCTADVVRRAQVPQFIIFGQDSAELTDFMEWLVECKYDNTAKYILICSSTNQGDCDEQSFFQELAHLYFGNLVYLKLANDNEMNNPVGYTVYPLQPGKCWNHDSVHLNITYDCVNDTCFKSLFPDKFNNLYQCPLNISTFEQPPYMYLYNDTSGLVPSGADGDILKLVTSILNASLHINTPPDKENWGHYQNNNWTGSLGDVFNKRAQASMCSAPLTTSKFGNFQISFTYNSMDMVWAAGLPAMKPSWEKLLYPLAIFMRFTLLFMFVAIIFVNSLLNTTFWAKIRNTVNIAPPKANLLFHSWPALLGMPITKMPTKSSLRMFVYAWFWFCLIVRCLYQAGLMGALKVNVYENRLETFSDVLNTNHPFGGLPALREYYSEDPEIYDHWIFVDLADAYDTLDKISSGDSDLVMAMNKDTLIDYLIINGGRRQVQIIPEKIVNSPTAIYFKKNSYLTAAINHCLTIALEGGFTQRLYARYVEHAKTLSQQSKTNGPEPLQLQHFTSCIILLVSGWILSAIFFVVEFVCGIKGRDLLP